MRVKRQLLALVCAALMAIAMVVPTAAAETGTLDVSGTIMAQLTIELGSSSITFPNPSLDACNTTTKTEIVTVTSNTRWGITVTASSTGTNKLPVSKLYWSGGVTNQNPPSCGASPNPGTAFADGDNIWLGSSSQGPTSTGGSTYYMAFALKLDTYETGGPFNFELVFQVTQ